MPLPAGVSFLTPTLPVHVFEAAAPGVVHEELVLVGGGGEHRVPGVRLHRALVGRAEFTLGRVSEGQPLIPEIDLSVYKAYDQGVSRLHAVLSIRTDQVSITDLGSANGTWLNGVRLPPHTAHTLKNGDLISLGTMKIQALIE